MSGRRSSNCEGTPGGIATTFAASAVRDGKRGGRFAEKHRDGVFELCAQDADVGGLCARKVELRYGSSMSWPDARPVSSWVLCQLERLPSASTAASNSRFCSSSKRSWK
jgi:hypothetical protein